MDNDINKFCEKIDELRTVLNKESSNLLNDEMKDHKEIINISRELDDLIVKYHLLKNIKNG